MKKYSRSILIALLTIIMIVGVMWRVEEVKKIDSYRFSNTQTWDETLSPLRYKETNIVSDADNKIRLADAPTNTSRETRHDLKELHKMIALRTDETLQRIESEIKIPDAYFGEYTYTELTSTSTHPFTSFFIQVSLNELGYVIMRNKDKFDRVRPSYLDPSLSTTIDVPNHPSYPSGHATQSYFVALMMSELDPENRDKYIESAYRIAEGREIAGVHYPSDSEAGRSLATQYFNLLKETSWYATYFELAKKEW